MKIFKLIAWLLLFFFIVIQFFPTVKNKSEIVPATDLMKTRDVPRDVAALFQNSCYDCHSNNTDYPWYNKMQPVAWFMERHIKEGKKELNFNEFGSYSKRRQKSKLKGIANQLKDDEMPLTSYTLFHRDAKVSEKEKKMVVNWIDKTLKTYK